MASTNHKHFQDIAEQTYDFLMGIKEDHPDMCYLEIYAAVKDAVTLIEEDL